MVCHNQMVLAVLIAESEFRKLICFAGDQQSSYLSAASSVLTLLTVPALSTGVFYFSLVYTPLSPGNQLHTFALELAFPLFSSALQFVPDISCIWCSLTGPCSLCTGSVVSAQTASHRSPELTDVRSPSSLDIEGLMALEDECQR